MAITSLKEAIKILYEKTKDYCSVEVGITQFSDREIKVTWKIYTKKYSWSLSCASFESALESLMAQKKGEVPDITIEPKSEQEETKTLRKMMPEVIKEGEN